MKLTRRIPWLALALLATACGSQPPAPVKTELPPPPKVEEEEERVYAVPVAPVEAAPLESAGPIDNANNTKR